MIYSREDISYNNQKKQFLSKRIKMVFKLTERNKDKTRQIVYKLPTRDSKYIN